MLFFKSLDLGITTMKGIKKGMQVLGMVGVCAAAGYASAGQVQADSGSKISLDGGKAYLYNNQWGVVKYQMGRRKSTSITLVTMVGNGTGPARQHRLKAILL